jgi:hypothetical protein
LKVKKAPKHEKIQKGNKKKPISLPLDDASELEPSQTVLAS